MCGRPLPSEVGLLGYSIYSRAVRLVGPGGQSGVHRGCWPGGVPRTRVPELGTRAALCGRIWRSHNCRSFCSTGCCGLAGGVCVRWRRLATPRLAHRRLAVGAEAADENMRWYYMSRRSRPFGTSTHMTRVGTGAAALHDLAFKWQQLKALYSERKRHLTMKVEVLAKRGFIEPPRE